MDILNSSFGIKIRTAEVAVHCHLYVMYIY